MIESVFFDRDGVINYAKVVNNLPYPPDDLKSFKIIPETAKLIMWLHFKNIPIFIVTNQPDVKRMKQSKEVIDKIHDFVMKVLPITKIYTCFHIDEDNCECRKPKPGLLFQASEEYKINLFYSFMIGDRFKDVMAGFNAGCQTVFVDYGYSEQSFPIQRYTVKDISKIKSILEKEL